MPHEARTTRNDDFKPPTGGDAEGMSITSLPADPRTDSAHSLVLGLDVTSFAAAPANAGSGPEKADNFSLVTYAGADGQTFMETVFAGRVTEVLVIERGGNDTGKIILFDAQENLVGMPMEFSPADFGDTGYTAGGQAAKGIVIVGEAPFTKVRILKPASGDLGIDPLCICGM